MTGGEIKEEAPEKKISLDDAKIKSKKPAKKPKKKDKKTSSEHSLNIPVLEAPVVAMPLSRQRDLSIVETSSISAKKTIRRSGIEIKKAEEKEEKKRIAQEKEWEIPAFLRRVKFNK